MGLKSIQVEINFRIMETLNPELWPPTNPALDLRSKPSRQKLNFRPNDRLGPEWQAQSLDPFSVEKQKTFRRYVGQTCNFFPFFSSTAGAPVTPHPNFSGGFDIFITINAEITQIFG